MAIALAQFVDFIFQITQSNRNSLAGLDLVTDVATAQRALTPRRARVFRYRIQQAPSAVRMTTLSRRGSGAKYIAANWAICGRFYRVIEIDLCPLNILMYTYVYLCIVINPIIKLYEYFYKKKVCLLFLTVFLLLFLRLRFVNTL